MVQLASMDKSFEKYFTDSKSLIRIKHLFLLFIKQLETEEFKLFCKYLNYLLKKHSDEPLEIFDVVLKDLESNGFYESIEDDDKDEIVKSFSVVDDFNYYSKPSESDDDDYEDLDEDFDKNKKSVKTNRNGTLNDKVKAELEKKYQSNNLLTANERKQLAKKLRITERQIQKWFISRRERQNKVNNVKTKSEKVLKNNDNLDNSKSVIVNEKTKSNDVCPDVDNKENDSIDVTKNEEKSESQAKPRGRRSRRKLDEETTIEQPEPSGRRLSLRRQSLIDKKETDETPDVQSPPPKRACRNLSDEIVSKLEDFYAKNNQADETELKEIEKETKLSEYLIKKWFKQKRETKLKSDRKPESPKQEDEDKQDESDMDFIKNFSNEAIEELEKSFEKSANLRPLDKKALSLRLGLKTIDIERWFYFKRKESHKS